MNPYVPTSGADNVSAAAEPEEKGKELPVPALTSSTGQTTVVANEGDDTVISGMKE